MRDGTDAPRQALTLKEMGRLARPANKRAFLEAVRSSARPGTAEDDARADEAAALSALLDLSLGEAAADERAAKQAGSKLIEIEAEDEFDFIPSRDVELRRFGEGHIPDHLGVAPVARTVLPPSTEIQRDLAWDKTSFGTAPLLSLNRGINVDRLAYPWCCIGRVFVSGFLRFGPLRIPFSKSGSGSLVGRNLLVTASHVIPRGAESLRIEFVPALSVFDPKRPFESAFVTTFRRHKKAKGVTGYDIVVCRLDRNMGDLTGWFGYVYNNNDDFYYDASFCSAGYPGIYYNADEMIAEYNLKVRDIDGDSYDGKEIEMDAFTNHGWSGGPLFAWFDNYPYPLVVGVLSGREKDVLDPQRSVFAGGKRLVDLVGYGLTNWA